MARLFRQTVGFRTPATDQEIAAERSLSIEAVKSHLRNLSHKFGVQDLPLIQKRARLGERAVMSGAITRRDLGPEPAQ